MQGLNYEEFSESFLYTSTAERQFQLAIQATIDIGEHILAELMTEPPTDYGDVFVKLGEAGVLSSDFADKLVGMARFRNILVHVYLELDLEKLHTFLQEDLDDFEEFARCVTEFIERYTTSESSAGQ